MPRNTSRPTVKLRKKLYLLRLSFLMNGYHKRPIITGITPTYVPIRAKYDACFTVGCGVRVAN